MRAPCRLPAPLVSTKCCCVCVVFVFSVTKPTVPPTSTARQRYLFVPPHFVVTIVADVRHWHHLSQANLWPFNSILCPAINRLMIASSLSRVVIRKATTADLPSIQTLIRDSYAAMADYPDISAQLLAASNVTDASWKKASEIAIGKKLTEDTFGCAYDGLNNLFWVAEEEGGLVLGCVGLERAKPTDSQADVVRMAVSRDERGGGVGGKLIAHLAEHAKYRMEGVETLHLTTANPRAANFYHKHQFERIFPSLTKALPIAHPVTELIHEMVRRF